MSETGWSRRPGTDGAPTVRSGQLGYDGLSFDVRLPRAGLSERVSARWSGLREAGFSMSTPLTNSAPASSADYGGAFKGKRALVTGGAGFIGGHLAQRLVSLGVDVRVLDDFSSGHRYRVPPTAVAFEGSVTDRALVRRAISGCDLVFHEAAMVSVAQSVQDPARCAEVNILGTEYVLEEAVTAGVSRLVFAASAAAYGASPMLPSQEAHPVDCRSPYAASKVAGEALLSAFAACYPISTVSLRYFNVFGPHQDPKSPYAAAISAFVDAISSGRTPSVFGDGQQTRDFVFVDNVIHANLLAAACHKRLAGEVLNVATGRSVTLVDAISSISQALGRDCEPNFGPERPGDLRHSRADISRARKLLGYEPVVSFDDGILQTVRWSTSHASGQSR
jgi:UDP-glucose 4-epimerase